MRAHCCPPFAVLGVIGPTNALIRQVLQLFAETRSFPGDDTSVLLTEPTWSGVIVHSSVRGGAGLELAHVLRAHGRDVPFMLVADLISREQLNRAVALGAVICAEPIDELAVLGFAVRACESTSRARERPASTVRAKVAEWSARFRLTEAEAEVLAATASGMDQCGIALTRRSSPSTVRKHMENLLRKTGHLSVAAAAICLLNEALNPGAEEHGSHDEVANPHQAR